MLKEIFTGLLMTVGSLFLLFVGLLLFLTLYLVVRYFIEEMKGRKKHE